MTARYKSL